ncbi:MAG: outer membrane protein transport protein [Cyclobacteriaceae bacterium]|nr:outer membrane protein transport protein [Cyclobacteriaceae bacterium]
MKTWGKWLIGITMLAPIAAGAQSFTETALLFSRTQPAGSARIMGMSGAQTSLGGDYSSALSNPAGLGMFNKSEFSISPGFNSSNINSTYLGNTVSDSKSNLHIPGFGLVFQTEQDGRNGFLSGTFGVSYSRINNFNQSFSYEGLNNKNSIIDYFIQDATGQQPSTFLSNGSNFNTPTGLAYSNYLIGESTLLDPNNDPTEYFSDVPINNYPFQSENIQAKGAQNQWSFSYGANFNDKFFIGGGVGFTSLRYQTTKTYKEAFTRIDTLRDLALQENLRINGSGINATIGFIYRPIEIFQVGLSYATPTLYKLTDTYNATMATNWNSFDYYGDGSKILTNESEYTDDVISEYDLRTPSRLNIGASLFFQKYGFLSADVQLVNYSGAKYSSSISGISYTSDNDKIKSLYQPTINYRVGGEFRYNSYRVRGGFSYMPDPFRSEQNGVSRQITSVSGGLGYRANKFYLDMALVFTQGQSTYRPYRINSPDSPLMKLDNKTTFGMITLGFPF